MAPGSHGTMEYLPIHKYGVNEANVSQTMEHMGMDGYGGKEAVFSHIVY